MTMTADNLTDSITAQFYERYGDVQAFALSPALQSKNRTTIVEMLNNLSKLYGMYDLVLVVNAHGRLVAVTDKDPSGKPIKVDALYAKDFSKEKWFNEVMSGKTTDDVAKNLTGTHVEDPSFDAIVSEAYGEDRYTSGFSSAIRNPAGEVIGVITNRAGIRWLGSPFEDAAHIFSQIGHTRGVFTVVSKDGTVLYEHAMKATTGGVHSVGKANLIKEDHPAAKALQEGKTGHTVHTEPRRTEEYFYAYMPISTERFVDKLGWGVIVGGSYAELHAVANRADTIFGFVMLAMLVAGTFVSVWFAKRLSHSLSEISKQLGQGSSQVDEASGKIAESSTELSESATEQAAAIQETAASIDEVSAMVKKSSENAVASKKTSQKSREAAERGQSAVQEMLQSIEDIQKSNGEIMSQVEASNREISDIVKVISEIGNKTKVINDIVFQTKLLSFNASVEAARAGEHGKGFAVVAEEVGNLAQMSGNAAKEISEMLDGSIRKVENIVTETKTRVEGLIQNGKSKVEVGTRVAQRCGEALENILSSVQEVDTMVSEIASASQEQAQGVSEINKAINQLDQVTQQNTAVSQVAANSAETLSSQARDLRQMVQELERVIQGGSGEAAPLTHKNPVKQEHKPVGQVIHLPKKEPAGAKTHQYPTKKAVGAPAPSAEDSRFTDV